MVQYFLQAMNNYATFTGRSRRAEYWYFVLACFVLGFLTGIFGFFTGMSEKSLDLMTLIIQLVLLIPSISVAVRRVHDSDHSGWFVLLPFYNIYLMFKRGTNGPNRFGPDPLAPLTTAIPPATPPQGQAT